MLAVFPNIEIVSCAQIVSRQTGKEYLSVRIIDSANVEKTFCDFNICNEDYYIRGTHGTLFTDVDIGKKFTNFTILKFVEGKIHMIVEEKETDEFKEINLNGKLECLEN